MKKMILSGHKNKDGSFESLEHHYLYMKKILNNLNELGFSKHFFSDSFNYHDFFILLIFFHDFGKIKKGFQDKILGNLNIKDSTTWHLNMGVFGFFLYCLIKFDIRNLNNISDISDINKLYIILIGCSIIINHHSRTISFKDNEDEEMSFDNNLLSETSLNKFNIFNFIKSSDLKTFVGTFQMDKSKEFINNLNNESFFDETNIDIKIIRQVAKILNDENSYNDISNLWNDYLRFVKNSSDKLLCQNSYFQSLFENFYEDFHIMFSKFIKMDEFASAFIEDTNDVVDKNIQIRANIIKDYYKNKFGNLKQDRENLNDLRAYFFDELDKLSPQIGDKKIITINAGTGIGKTLSVFNLAFQEKEKIKANKIIYISPLITIGKQNYNIIKNILNESYPDFIESNNNVLISEHTSESIRKFQVGSNIGNDLFFSNKNYSTLLLEGWSSNIIFTTFVQFFDSYLNNKKKNLKKLVEFENSIIIIDEIQEFHSLHLEKLNKFIKFVNEKLNSKIIISSATIPNIFDNKHGNIRFDYDFFSKISENEKKYFDRYKIKYLNELSVEILKDDIVSKINKKNDYRILVVLPTRKSCEILYEFLKKDGIRTDVITTKLTKFDRLSKIKKYKSKEENVVLITTPLIKAGVDFSFEIGYTDLFNIPDIQQIGGRINRNGEYGYSLNTKSTLYIFELTDDIIRKQMKGKEICWQKGFKIDDYRKELNKKNFSSEHSGLNSKFFSLEYKCSKEFIRSGIVKSELSWYSNIKDYFNLLDENIKTYSINKKTGEDLLYLLFLNSYNKLFKMIDEDEHDNIIKVFINNNIVSNKIYNDIKKNSKYINGNLYIHKNNLDLYEKYDGTLYDYKSFIVGIERNLLFLPYLEKIFIYKGKDLEEFSEEIDEIYILNKKEIKIDNKNTYNIFDLFYNDVYGFLNLQKQKEILLSFGNTENDISYLEGQDLLQKSYEESDYNNFI